MESSECWQPRTDHDRLRDTERSLSTHGMLLVILIVALAWLFVMLAKQGLLKLPADG